MHLSVWEKGKRLAVEVSVGMGMRPEASPIATPWAKSQGKIPLRPQLTARTPGEGLLLNILSFGLDRGGGKGIPENCKKKREKN